MRYETSVVVDRPIEEVWAFLTDPFHMARYGIGTLGARLDPPEPIRVGTTFRGRAAFLGFEGKISAVITECDPPRAFTSSGRVMGLALSRRTTLEATADGTRVVRATEYHPGSASKLVWWIVEPLARRREDDVARAIKKLLEAGPRSSAK